MKILVIGDIMLDKYIEGYVNRISPESPNQIVDINNSYHVLGGCGNVISNLDMLDMDISICANIGSDINAQKINNLINKLDVENLIINRSYTTTTKTRIISSEFQSQILRLDDEDINPIQAKYIIDKIKDVYRFDLIIISDYAKGMITKELMDFLKSTNIKIIADPKPINKDLYNDIFMITPNLKEWDKLKYYINNIQYVVETRGKDGIRLYDNLHNKIKDIQGKTIKIFNVTGCGDVVIAVIAACISNGYDILTAVRIANECATYTATLSGTSIITKDKFIEIKEKYKKKG